MIRCRTILFLAATLAVGLADASAAVTLNFSINSIVGDTSTGLTLGGYSIRIGKFQSITPTSGNYSLWNANFIDLTGITTGSLVTDNNSFVTAPLGQFGPFLASGDASETYSAYPTGFSAGDQIDVWIYNNTASSASTQALLVTQATWLLPVVSGAPSSVNFGWINGEFGAGALSIVGGVGSLANNSYKDGSNEKGVDVVTSAVPEPASGAFAGLGIAILISFRRRRSTWRERCEDSSPGIS